MIKRVLISRTDSIGDVILTLPLAGIIKKFLPETEVHFLGRGYTIPIIASCKHVDGIWNWDEIKSGFVENSVENLWKSSKLDSIIHVFPRKEIAQWAAKLKIPERIGTSSRWYNWLWCNSRVALHRKNSELHEAQLNAKLLSTLIPQTDFSLSELSDFAGFSNIYPLDDKFVEMLLPDKFNLILHPKSQNSAREWNLTYYEKLVRLLPREHFRIFITGTESEKIALKDFFSSLGDSVVDLTGKMNLSELISFISAADGLVAASTGPLHIAGALGKFAVGLYPPIRPMHAGRWAPLGKNVQIFSARENCVTCRNQNHCVCMDEISPEEVASAILNFGSKKYQKV